MSCTSRIHPFSLGNYLETSLIIGNLLRIRITNVDFDLNIDLDSLDVDDVAPPTVKLSDAKRHASLLFSFFLKNSLYFGVNENISFQKLGGNLDKMTIANLGRQHQHLWTPILRVLEKICIFWSYKLLFHTIYIA